ncbi:hypothetical protein CK203_077666 [Vitis vinifera]|uniref:Uncharacterized protein n=1 Tax=Vitis vinifera TaxID=29760 RepID=A0A438BWX4_VITVI|nr:hypothetical protein CK203_077666 [Vitis vinifera]
MGESMPVPYPLTKRSLTMIGHPGKPQMIGQKAAVQLCLDRGQFLQQIVIKSPRLTPPLYATAAMYIASGSPFYPNLQSVMDPHPQLRGEPLAKKTKVTQEVKSSQARRPSTLREAMFLMKIKSKKRKTENLDPVTMEKIGSSDREEKIFKSMNSMNPLSPSLTSTSSDSALGSDGNSSCSSRRRAAMAKKGNGGDLCIKQWYPNMSKTEIAELCPFCRRNCNCNLCLHSSGMVRTVKTDISDGEKWASGLWREDLIMCMHGEDLSLESYYMGTFRHDAESLTDWNATKDGSIICALKGTDGCGGSLLQLKHILPEDRTLDLKERAEQVMMKFGIEQARNSPTSRSDQSCSLGSKNEFETKDGMIEMEQNFAANTFSVSEESGDDDNEDSRMSMKLCRSYTGSFSMN